jgi:hypothetical protein
MRWPKNSRFDFVLRGYGVTGCGKTTPAQEIGKGTTLVVPLNRRKQVCALEPEGRQFFKLQHYRQSHQRYQ